jgi:PIN domain nuclease of toxin-antitoxin system
MELDARLKQALAMRDRLAEEVNKIEARRELAQKNLADVEAEIRAKGIDPDQIDEKVRELEEAYAAALTKFEAELDDLDKALAPYRTL